MQRLFLLSLGWYLVLHGLLLILRPAAGKRLSDGWLKDKVSRPWSLVPLSFGALMLWAADASKAAAFIMSLGVVAVLKGVFTLVAPKAHLTGIVAWWNSLTLSAYRAWGLPVLLVGAAILLTL